MPKKKTLKLRNILHCSNIIYMRYILPKLTLLVRV